MDFELTGDQYFLRRIPGTSEVIVNGEPGELLRVDVVTSTKTSVLLPPDWVEQGGAVTNVLFSADGSRWMVTDDDSEMCWEYDGRGWSKPAAIPHANTSTDLCYLWQEDLILRKNFGVVYYRWLGDVPKFERANAVYIRRDSGTWMRAVESFPSRGCVVHRSWQDTCDLVYCCFEAAPARVGYVSWSDPSLSWSTTVTAKCLRMAALPTRIFVLVAGADQRLEILDIQRNGQINAISPPDGYTFKDIETVVTASWTGLVAVASPWSCRGRSRLLAWKV